MRAEHCKVFGFFITKDPLQLLVANCICTVFYVIDDSHSNYQCVEI